MARFVILRHDSPRSLHWDFMLEHDGALRTWALESPPSVGTTIAAEALADHRLAYLDYEGPISGNRGVVARWDTGDYEVSLWNDDRVCVNLRGQKLQGAAELICTSAPTTLQRWSIRFMSASSDSNEASSST